MAVALRPAVLLIVLASILFLAAGVLDTTSGAVDAAAIESWIFSAVNVLVAVFIARGNERILALRIGLAAFFMVERPLTAVAFGPKPIEGIALHMATAIVEAFILISTLRVWRLGHSVSQTDLAFLTLPTSPAPRAATVGAARADVPLSTSGRPTRSRIARERIEEAKPLGTRPRPLWGFGLIGALALLLSAVLIGDAVVRGIVPGATVDLASPEWLAYVFALVILVVAARAVHQGRFAVRLLLVVALITFVERAFTPFALGIEDSTPLGLHAAAALLALGLALTCAASLGASRARRSPPAPL
ncbi:MAG: hypothetical protein HYY42_07265 [Chloroflexi bacterium]|nr:hypothetical protein [Chloroflexota bacterium]MBI2983955.1 hypothetical protein [Chloroflexota bacterium]